ncbi:MAG TPA: hypothetical protein VN893_14965 [Bryobacteraceae bacterium]|nr:hypothetical protein [Bryobacteraceae bacterium]
MTLHVLTDDAGEIIATHVAAPTLPLPPPSPAISTLIRPSAGQSLHQVELNPELAQHVLQNTLLEELGRWKVEGQGTSARLVKR